ncbi:MAG: malto-oligosyltrehalose synthase [Gammaproteobacteria bacterium]|nr:malto-oligosyltrehalose synthase [Gammaproteobacteria bacterium]
MSADGVPIATYRLQLNRDFTFADARGIVPYLQALGISHVYASPFLKARAGSSHGYDIVDHDALNPEIGNEADLTAFTDSLHRHGMGLVMDIVPNHMGVGGGDNGWWLDVLEHGEASPYADYFDIDWRPASPALRHKVLLPFLGDHYGAVLEDGGLVLGFDATRGAFDVRYYEHLFPIDPRSYPAVLGHALDPAGEPTLDSAARDGLEAVAAACRALPRRSATGAARRRERRRAGAGCKERLAALCRDHPAVEKRLHAAATALNGTPGESASFDRLHRLLEAQAYRLAYWLVAADEINYRRFFDINDLAGIRVEDADVFTATHRLVLRLVADGHVQGLRVDHPDGLWDPQGYFGNLQTLTSAAAGAAGEGFYLLAEKVLADHEHLPADWAVAGTTGYETAHLINGLLVDPSAERDLTRLYQGFTGRREQFDEILYHSRKLIINSVLASELAVLANMASAIARTDRHTRDFTYHRLRDALAETAACFPVYRTYLTAVRAAEADHRHIRWAIAQAKRRNPAADLQVYDFLEGLLGLANQNRRDAAARRLVVRLALRFQQYTAPVMAKGMEDTAFYVYNRLTALNDVGFDPRVFGVSVKAFHHGMGQRVEHHPHGLVTTSTHDSKRSEDVRARTAVLSEAPRAWGRHLARWRQLNRIRKRQVHDTPAPSPEDEYLLYQTLAGAWPMECSTHEALAAFRERTATYMEKVVNEAKTHSSWINPDDEYLEATRAFVTALLDDPERNPFLADFIPFQQSILRYGLLNSLSQTLLKLTVPGVPDIYQGTELWNFSLVDPDNRRPVDYERRRRLLETLSAEGDATPALARELMAALEDGRAKLHVIRQALRLRQGLPELFRDGGYAGLATWGTAATHLAAFARHRQDDHVVVAVPRWLARLDGGTEKGCLGTRAWRDTTVACPEAAVSAYRNVLSGEKIGVRQTPDGAGLAAAELFATFPAALLVPV